MTLFVLIGVSGECAETQENSAPKKSENDVVISSDQSPPKNQAVAATSRTQQTLKGALTVVNEIESVAYLAAPTNASFANGTKILFVRRRGPRVDPIAQGQVIGEDVNPKTKVVMIKVQVDRDTVVKYPQTGDRAVLLANEMIANAPDPKENIDVPEVVEKKKPEEDLPGYLEYGMGLLMMGSLDATPSSNANIAKKTAGYRFKNTHLAYYSDFFPVGIEMDSHVGQFPTLNYKEQLLTSEEEVSTMSLNYRFRPWMNKKLFPRARLVTLTDSFKTSNEDENLLTTKISATGLGGRLDYEFASPVWRPTKNDWFFKFQSVQAEMTYFFSVKPEDIGISRGTKEASSGTGMQYGVKATVLLWLDFVPFVKRWVVQAGYQTRSYDLKFAGATVSEVGNPYKIPEGSTSKEKETDFRFFIGIRLDDPIRLMFPNKEKNKDQQK